jgi:hypothetical protein
MAMRALARRAAQHALDTRKDGWQWRSASCCALDGTWNEEGQTDHGVEVETNVLKLYKALVNSPAQVDRYFAGVGTRPFEKVSGGAFGWGLFNQIKDAYRALIRVYDAGDQIFIFGFSRGAYSARSLAGMVLRCGVLRKDVDHGRLGHRTAPGRPAHHHPGSQPAARCDRQGLRALQAWLRRAQPRRHRAVQGAQLPRRRHSFHRRVGYGRARWGCRTSW